MAATDYTERTKALRKMETIAPCTGCGREYDGTIAFYGYGDNAECATCALGESEEA